MGFEEIGTDDLSNAAAYSANNNQNQNKMFCSHLIVGLNTNQFHAGLNEIDSHFEGKRSDGYLDELLQEVGNANQALFEAMHVASVKHHVQQEARLLKEWIVSAVRCIESYRCAPDAEVKASAEVLKALFRSFGKPLTRMSVNTLLGATEVLLRELGKPEMQAHVGKLPELSERIKGIQEALDALAAKQLEVDQANSRMVKPEPLISLKREAAAKLEVLVDYLRVMSTKDVQTYGEDYAVVTEIISRHNATYRGGAPKTSSAQAETPDSQESQTV